MCGTTSLLVMVSVSTGTAGCCADQAQRLAQSAPQLLHLLCSQGPVTAAGSAQPKQKLKPSRFVHSLVSSNYLITNNYGISELRWLGRARRKSSSHFV